MDDIGVAFIRRQTVAMTLLIAGPTGFGALDPAHVLIGAGTGFTPEETESFGGMLIREGRHMVYAEYSYSGERIAFEGLSVVAPGKKGVWWWSDCLPWAPGWTGEVALVPYDEGARGRFVNREGALKYMGSRPTGTDQGVFYGMERLKRIAGNIKEADCLGQSRDDLQNGGLRYWQREGFRIRENGRVFTPNEAADLHGARAEWLARK